MHDKEREPVEGPRAKYLTSGDGGSAPAFTLTRAELSEVVADAVGRALGTMATLVDKQGLAQRLSVSVGHIDHLRKKGLPTVTVGAAVRFDPDDVLRWLRSRPIDNDTE